MKLLNQMRSEIRFRHLSIRTEKSYIDWVKRFIFFHDKKHPDQMGEVEIKVFLNWQYLFPSKQLSIDSRSSKKQRHHIHMDSVQKMIRKAVVQSRVPKKGSSHSLRHSFATLS
jgi:hypothetical protein